MKLSKWLKSVFLFPFMILMGVGAEGTGSVDPVEDNDDSANEGGDDPLAEEGSEESEPEYEVDEDGEPILDEEGNLIPKVAEGEETDEGKPDHKKNAQERIQQLANEKREMAERLAKLEQQFAKQQEEKPDFVEIDMDKVNAYIAETTDKIETVKLEGNFLAAKKLEIQIAKLISDIDSNDEKKAAYLERQNKTKGAETAVTETLQKLDNAAEFYRSQLKIEKPVWEKMGTWFSEQCKSDPLLGAEFQEQIEKSAIGAIRWAHEYTTKNMGANAAATIDKKNKNKQTAAAASPSASGKQSPVDLSKALATAKEKNTTEGWVEYRQLKRAAEGR